MGAAYHLEQLYTEIQHVRMADIPILNPRLKVQAVGFREWNGHVLGVLITPWFMNLMILPTERTDWSNHQVGTKHKYVFDAGTFEFIVGEEEELGQYMSCSMFSPMFDFEDQKAAVETAEAIVVGMFKEENKEVLSDELSLVTDEIEEENLVSVTEGVLEGVQAVGAIAKQNLEKPLSRRELLRGGFLRSENNRTVD